MAHEMEHVHNALGANWIEQQGRLVPNEYGNTAEAVRAAEERVVLCDRSHWGRLRLLGRDHLTFLHNYTTADFKRAQPGDAIEAVALTATARLIDLLTVLVSEDESLLITSPERRAILPNWFRRFIFFGTDLKIEDITDQTALFTLAGPQSAAVLEHLHTPIPETGRFVNATIADVPVKLAAGSGLALPGFTIVAPQAHAAALFEALFHAGQSFGIEPMGAEAWEILRVLHGRPAADHEITEDYNPLEAGLWDAISFNKGCYIGQEVVARLDTYAKIKQHLMRLRLSAPAPVGSPLITEEREVGRLTSLVETPDGAIIGLGYVRRDWATPGTKVAVQHGDTLIEAVLEEPRYVRRERPPELP